MPKNIFFYTLLLLLLIGSSLFISSYFLSNNLEILEGKENLSMYQFNTKVAKHYFCKICGIYTHHQRRSNPNEFAVNVGCIDEIDPYEYFNLKVENNDGNNHILDRVKK